MDHITLSKEDEEFLEHLLSNQKKVCASCLQEVEVDYEQTHTYCEICEAYVEVITAK